MPIVKIIHHKDGTKTTTVEGITGEGCREVSKKFLSSDEVITDEETSEMHEAVKTTEKSTEIDNG